MTTKAKPRARRKKVIVQAPDIIGETIQTHQNYFAETEVPKQLEIRNCRIVGCSGYGISLSAEHVNLDDRHGGFYTPVDGWKPGRPMMEECDFPTFEEAIAYSDAWFYWAVNRDEMI